MRSLFRRAASVMIGAMLFAQAALALSACEWPKRVPANAFAEAPTCHEAPARNSNLCLVHCLNEDQSRDVPQVKVHALPAAAVLFVDVSPAAIWTSRAAPAFSIPWTGPPPRILFQSLLI